MNIVKLLYVLSYILIFSNEFKIIKVKKNKCYIKYVDT